FFVLSTMYFNHQASSTLRGNPVKHLADERNSRENCHPGSFRLEKLTLHGGDPNNTGCRQVAFDWSEFLS
ncbi:MAG: hypothetical protein AB7Y74_14665, partial [Syntrophorhabdus sp.]